MIQRTQGNTQRIAIAVEKAELNKEGEIIRTPFEFEAGDRVAVTLYGKRKYIYTPELATGVAVVTLIGTEICDVYDMRVDITRADGTRNAYNERSVLELVPEQVPEVGVIDTSVFLFAKGETAIIDDMDGDAPDFAPSQRAVKEYLNDNVVFFEKPEQISNRKELFIDYLNINNEMAFLDVTPDGDIILNSIMLVDEQEQYNGDIVCKISFMGENAPVLLRAENRPYEGGDIVGYDQLIQLSNALDTTFYRDYYGNIKAKSGHASGQFTSDEKARVEEVISIGKGRTTLENFLQCTSNDGILKKIWSRYWDLSKIKNMQSAFRGQAELPSLILQGIGGSLENISYIAMNCKKLIDCRISSNTDDIVLINKCANAFNGCEELYSVRFANFYFDDVTDASFMFKGCKKLTFVEGLQNLRVSIDISDTNLRGRELDVFCYNLGDPEEQGGAVLSMKGWHYARLGDDAERSLYEKGWQINIIDD